MGREPSGYKTERQAAIERRSREAAEEARRAAARKRKVAAVRAAFHEVFATLTSRDTTADVVVELARRRRRRDLSRSAWTAASGKRLAWFVGSFTSLDDEGVHYTVNVCLTFDGRVLRLTRGNSEYHPDRQAIKTSVRGVRIDRYTGTELDPEEIRSRLARTPRHRF